MISRQRLWRLRNEIPVDHILEELDLPTKLSEGYLRFLCPLCREFNTATNPRTNLARCFRCSRNFNPIDLVMVVHGLPFLEAVAYLTPLLPAPP